MSSSSFEDTKNSLLTSLRTTSKTDISESYKEIDTNVYTVDDVIKDFDKHDDFKGHNIEKLRNKLIDNFFEDVSVASYRFV